jgi:hypothetical protein
MAIRYDKRIGRTRRKLAEMIKTEFPELDLDVDPRDLIPQIPIYASRQWDCCSWDANVPTIDGSRSFHFYSWDRMTELVKFGFDYVKEGFEIELSMKTS